VIVFFLVSFALVAGGPPSARPFNLQRVLEAAAPAQAMRGELKTAADNYQQVLNCLQDRIRGLDERLAQEKSESARKLLAERRETLLAKLQEVFATMRRLLKAAEDERVASLIACADRHATLIPGADRTDAIIKAMDADQCDAELKGRHSIPGPSSEQKAALCAKDG
jgi:hypothetical protein